MSLQKNILARHRYAAQVLFVALVAMALCLVTEALNYRSGWNALWMFLLPVVLGFVFNRNAERGSFMAMVLPIVAFLSAIVTAWTSGL